MNIDTMLGIIGTALGVVGIITGYIFYLKGKRRKELCWSEDEVNLIKGYSTLFTDLKIRYKRKAIENLSVSKVAIWNSGNETIDKTDIGTAMPLLIRAFNDTDILDVKVLKMSNAANRFVTLLDEAGNFALLSFDYLDSNQGAVLQVIHTGTSALNIWVDGQVKGVKEIVYKTKRLDIFSRMIRIMLYLYGVATLVLVGFDLYNSFLLEVEEERLTWPTWFLVPLALSILVAIILDLRGSRNVARIPKELSIFEKSDARFRKK